jgi:hypothetical protein
LEIWKSKKHFVILPKKVMAKTLTLKYDFEPYKCCEIKTDGSWFRVTARQFRSFDGERRISTSIDENNQLIYRDYNGPIYLFKTNIIVESKGSNNFVYTSEGDPRDKMPVRNGFY